MQTKDIGSNEDIKKKLLSQTNSNTALNGYKEEEIICNDLNKDKNLKKLFIKFSGNNYDYFTRVCGTYKCDIQTNDKTIMAQVKKYKNKQFQQLDRHWIDDLIKYIPELKNTAYILKNLCEYPLLNNSIYIDKSKYIKKLCILNYTQSTLDKFIDNLNKYKIKFLHYVFYGINQEIRPEYLFGVEYSNNKRTKIIIFKIIDIINYLGKLNFAITKRKTVIVLGVDSIISLRRKRGDKGKKSSNQLQTKIIISKLIPNVNHEQYIL